MTLAGGYFIELPNELPPVANGTGIRLGWGEARRSFGRFLSGFGLVRSESGSDQFGDSG